MAKNSSEFRAYHFIHESLKEIGWIVKNPNFSSSGQVFTQHESLRNQVLKESLGRKVPENVVKLGDDLWWVIEAKAGHEKLENAVDEAKEYAKIINNKNPDSCLFISGVAGNKEDSFLVETYYLQNNNWKRIQINGYKTTGFLSQGVIDKILNNDSSSIDEEVVADELFVEKANKINHILHNGAINKRNRAKVIASLLLALAEDEYLKISKEPTTLIKDINTRVHSILAKYHKENFAQEIDLKLPTSKDNHLKHRQALVDTIQELKNLNIRSAINSGRDVLGQFYEVFLKYANDAKEIGIVLTPRHITEFAVECVDVRYNDFVFDPTCGTGGFLVSAFDYVKQKASNEQVNQFRKNHIYGIEQDPEIVGLALVNMIFRGDGKSNIYEGNALNNKFQNLQGSYKRIDLLVQKSTGQNFLSKVLMNPPFAIENEEEYKFVDHALSQMIEGGLLFAVVPNSTITSVSNGKGEITWRRELLKRHTIKSVIKLSDELFYPVASKGTYAIIVEAHKPHDYNNKTLFAIMDDGFTMKKAKRVLSDNLPSNIDLIKKTVKEFIILDKHSNELEKVIGFANLDKNDSTHDLAPESYLQASSDFSETFEITTNLLQAFINKEKQESRNINKKVDNDVKIFDIEEFFESIARGKCNPINSLKEGKTPVITTTESNNGIVGYYLVDSKIKYKDCITISANGSSCCAFYHPYEFTANPDVLIGKLKEQYDNLHFKIFICTAIRSSAWKFTYYRKCSNTKLLKDVKISIPVSNGEIDFDFIKLKVENSVGFKMLKKYLTYNS